MIGGQNPGNHDNSVSGPPQGLAWVGTAWPARSWSREHDRAVMSPQHTSPKLPARSSVLARGLTAGIVSSVVVASASISPAWAGSSRQLIDGQRIVHLTNVPADPRYRSSIGAPGPDRVGRAGPGRPAAQYASDIEEIARRYALSPALIEAVVRVESGFDPNAVSPKGASGLMQLMPQTAARLGVPDRFSPLGASRASRRLSARRGPHAP